jgi:cytochrome P450
MDTTQTLARPLAGMTPPPLKQASLWKRVRATAGNPFEIVPIAAYEESLFWTHTPLLGTMVMVNDPEGVRRVLLDNVGNYPKNDFEIRFFSAMFGEGLLSAGDTKWRTHRKVMAPSFGGKSVAAYAPIMAETAADFAGQWADKQDGCEIEVAEAMKELTLKIICRTMFSSDAAELTALAGPALDFTQASLKFGILDLMPLIGPHRMRLKQEAIHEHFSGMDAAIYRLIAARKTEIAEAPKDLLSRLIAATDPDNGVGLTPTEVRDEVITIFMAGYETTAVTMTWVWYLLSQHPREEAKLHAELDAVLEGRLPTADDVAQLPYTRMIIEEAMRLYPPAPGISVRQAQADDEICGAKVRKGTQVIISPWILHRHRRLWSDPLRFDPERFSPERNEQRPRFSYMPFGGGPRVCIGAALAMTEATLILATLAGRYRLSLCADQEIKLQTRITLRPRDGMRMNLTHRSRSV